MSDNNQPFIIDKNLGARLDMAAQSLPKTNADGRPVIEPTQEQKYVFDSKGWVLFPGVLTDNEIEEMRAFGNRLHHEPASIPEAERSALGGPLQKLADHPVVVGFMNEFVAHPALSGPECYGFRMESCSLFYRTMGEGRFGPHNGNGMLRFPGDSHLYRCIPGKAHSGLTRAVWELNGVASKDSGGTLLLTGSHKAVFTAPESIQSPDSPLWDTYSCPPGSLLIFTEALTHSARPWADKKDRLAIFSCYNTVNSKWHDWDPHPDLLASMPPMRRTLYRAVRAANNLVGAEYRH